MTSTTQSRFDRLCEKTREASYLQSTISLLEWDQQTKLPSGGVEYRADQLTYLAGKMHQMRTDPELGDLLGELSESELVKDPNSDAGATILELKRDYEKKVKLPERLVQEMTRAASVGQQVWIEARKENDFSKFAPNVKEIFRLKREQAEAVGYDEVPYDALLDDYEPQAKTREVAAALESLKNELVPLVAAIAESDSRPDASVLRRHFPQSAQEEFVRTASSQVGFDYTRGRLDIAHHPFCQESGPSDCRITTRYQEDFFSPAFFGTLHEAGHGIYEQGLRADWYGLPPGQYCSLGIHESQSRLWENLVGRSREFWTYFYPQAQSTFADTLGDVSQDDFFAAINLVEPSLIRVEADEATYNLHIIIRFQLEQAVINGDLDTDDLPTAWDEKYDEYLGLHSPTVADGVLQDIHWSAGLVGYFPTYSLGNLYAGQFFDAAEKELGALGPQFAKGQFQPLKEWLNQKIHQPGKCYSSPELGKNVTGTTLSHEPMMRHLQAKLAPIYGL